MKRKTSTTPARIWNFGVRLRPSEEFQAQLRKAHEYYNQLIEVELDRRERFRAARSKLADFERLEEAYRVANEAVDAARAEVKARRASQRKRVVDKAANAHIAALKERRREVGAELKAARAQLKEEMAAPEKARKVRTEDRLVEIGQSGPRIRERVNAEVLEAMLTEPWPEIWKDSARANAEAGAARKRLRAAADLSPGTYLMVEKAVEAASGRPESPRYHRWDGTGRIGVQMHRVPIADVLAGRCTFLQIDPLPADQWKTLSKRRQAKTRARIRIGSDGRAPRWEEFSVELHRPLPLDAVVTWAWIKVSRTGMRTRYHLQLTLESATFVARAARSTSTVAIDIGWRARPDGVRVGYCYDDRGGTRELLVPEEIRDQLWLADQLHSYCDQHFDAARAVLRTWMQAHRVPKWVTEATTHMAQWRAHKKLARVAAQWAAERMAEERLWGLWKLWQRERLGANRDLFDTWETIRAWHARQENFATPEDQIVLYLHFWRLKNRHLYQFESDVRSKALRRRKDLYRCWAKQLATQYSAVVVETFDLRTFARNAAPEEDAGRNALHRIQKDVAPSELRGALVHACGRDRVHAVAAEYSTRTCHRCGHTNEWERAQALMQTCAGCGASWDQDDNAARILLMRWFEGGGGDGKAGTARTPDFPPDRGPDGATAGPADVPVEEALSSRSQTPAEGGGIAAE